MASKYRVLAASRLRAVLARQSRPSEDKNDLAGPGVSLRQVASHMRMGHVHNSASPFVLKLPTASLKQFQPHLSDSEVIEAFETDQHLPGVWVESNVQQEQKRRLKKWDRREVPTINFSLPRAAFTKVCLKQALASASEPVKFGRNAIFPEEKENQKVLVEYSSPNVAKPFHVGHLRSTILGEFCANICEAVGHQVVRVNWLGDWGTQFGILLAALEEEADLDIHSEDSDKEALLQRLLEVYVRGNKRAEADETFAAKASRTFAKLESGKDEHLRRIWARICDLTITELEKTYDRLGVRFDHYHSESMYADSRNLLDLLKAKNLLSDPGDGRLGVQSGMGERFLTLVKSDGSTLYLTRDLATALHRVREFQPDRLLYVVDNAQTQHFRDLFHVLEMLGAPGGTKCEHINFGRLAGLSTRKGNAVFLKDFLDEAQDRTLERQSLSPNTRQLASPSWTADVLGITAVKVNDLKHARASNRAFSWEEALKMDGETGSALQYCHCRLCSLTMGAELSDDEDLGVTLLEPEATALVAQLAAFDEAVNDAYRELEPCHVVHFLFELTRKTSKALRTLSVKRAGDKTVARDRLTAFAAAKVVLSRGMNLLGLQPLEEM